MGIQHHAHGSARVLRARLAVTTVCVRCRLGTGRMGKSKNKGKGGAEEASANAEGASEKAEEAKAASLDPQVCDTLGSSSTRLATLC